MNFTSKHEILIFFEEIANFDQKMLVLKNSQSLYYFISTLGELANQDRDPLQSELEQEYNQYGDILQDAFLDSYNNLTIKSIHILKYFVSISDQIGNKYLLKTDDDSFIHLGKFIVQGPPPQTVQF